jgi:predicted  nucleic acid-binding Zn-ribbon protein
MASRFSERKTPSKDKSEVMDLNIKRPAALGGSETVTEEGKQRGRSRRIPPSGFGTLRPPAFTINLKDEDASLGGGGDDSDVDETVADTLVRQQTPMEENAQSMNEDGPASSRPRSRRQSLSQEEEEEMDSSPNLSIPGLERVPGSNPGLSLPGIRQGQVASIIPIFSVDKPPQQPSGDQKDDMSAPSPRDESFELDVQRTYAKQIRDQILQTLGSLQLTLGIPEATKTRLANISKTIPENARPGTETEQKALLDALFELQNEVTRASINEGTAISEKRNLDEKLQKALAADSDCQKTLKRATEAFNEAVRRSNEQESAKNDLEKDLRGLKEMTRTVLQERDDCETKLNECSKRAQRLEDDIKSNQKQHEDAIGALDLKLTDAQQDLINCRSKNGIKDGLLVEKDQQIQQLTSQLNEAKGFQKLIFKKVLGKKSGTIQMVEAAIDKQSSTLDTANNRIRQLEDEIGKLVVQVPTDEQRNAGTDMVLFQQQPRPSSPDSKRGQLIPAPGKDVVPIRMTDDPLDKCQDALRVAEAKLSNAEATISKLGLKVEELSAQLVSSKKAHDNVRTSLDECESKRTEQEDELGRLKSQKSALEGTLGAKEREILEQAAEIGRLKKGSLSTVAQRDNYQRELADKDGRINDLQQEIRQIKSKIQSVMDETKKEYDAAQSQYDSELDAKDREIKQLEVTIEGLRGRIAELQSQGNTLRGDEKKCEEDLKECKEALERLRRENKELENKLAAANRQTIDFNMQLGQANGQVEPLQKRVADYEQKLQACSQQLKGFQGDRRSFESKNQALLNQLTQVYQIANEQQIDVKRLREALDQGEFQRNIQQQLLDNKSKDAQERLQKGSTTACNWLEDAMEQIHRSIPSVQSPAVHDGMLLFYIHALCAEQHWGYLTARYMGNNYSMLYPLADQIALLLYEEYILKTPDPDAFFSKTMRHNVIRVLNAFMRVFHYHKAANDMRKETKNNRAVLRPAAVKYIFEFDKVLPDNTTNAKAYALEMRKDIMRAHKVFFELDLDTSEPEKPVGWNTFFSFGAANPDLPGTILNRLHNKDSHGVLWNTIKHNKSLYRYWRYDVSSPLVLLLPMWDLIGEYSGRPKRS